MSLFQGRRTKASAAIRISPPLARTDDLVVEELDGELLVYDSNNQRAHCLGVTAARVWRACDGEASVEAICAALDMDAETVNDALAELERTELLQSSGLLEVLNGNGNGASNGIGLTRREMGKRSAQVGGAAFAAPLILSIAAPTPAAAATVIPFQCEVYTVQSCGTSDACGHIAGCCCCCQGGGACKTCGATAFCNLGTQPCSPEQGGGFGTHCSSVGSTPANPSGCCGVTGASMCGCGFGPFANCCTPTTGVACTPTTGTTTCFPCCAGKQLTSAAALGCCTSPTINCCDPTVVSSNPCCSKSTINTDCCVSNPPACCSTGTCP
jgi:hypothetical protein